MEKQAAANHFLSLLECVFFEGAFMCLLGFGTNKLIHLKKGYSVKGGGPKKGCVTSSGSNAKRSRNCPRDGRSRRYAGRCSSTSASRRRGRPRRGRGLCQVLQRRTPHVLLGIRDAEAIQGSLLETRPASTSAVSMSTFAHRGVSKTELNGYE